MNKPQAEGNVNSGLYINKRYNVANTNIMFMLNCYIHIVILFLIYIWEA